ncbi:membrane protein [Enterobacteria phage vB_EcoM_IME341]|uniref:Putative membrane protein n=1 Tax=Enterobacteria phage vB_EcoM_IME341 TaxID=2163891 RepID=A0A2S1GRQ7_9CAUD|nr:membrane protein [Enterobacteria phage vB_EcoM_IME341]AWD92084.1 putative membrane protein [Enterobacteria phage vB_EcoM_IME341]
MALYEPGCMGIDVNFIRRSENAGIIIPRGENMIIKKSWRNLDDGDEGISASTIDWSGCTAEMKQLLIEEYKMGYIVNGWQPEPHKEQTPDPLICYSKKYGFRAWSDEYDKLVSSRFYVWMGILFFPLLWFFLTTDNDLPICVFASAMSAAISGLIASFLWTSVIEVPFRISKVKKVYDDISKKNTLNSFIEECRK